MSPPYWTTLPDASWRHWGFTYDCLKALDHKLKKAGQGTLGDGDNFWWTTKPYAASGSYIHKMSDYCKNCYYNVKNKTGKTACRFNYLYWDFLARNQDSLKHNHRLGFVYKTWDRFTEEKKKATRTSAKEFLNECK